MTHYGARRAEIVRTVEELVECLRQEGYEFIAPARDYPSRQCWEAREPESSVTDVPPHCFVHTRGTPH